MSNPTTALRVRTALVTGLFMVSPTFAGDGSTDCEDAKLQWLDLHGFGAAAPRSAGSDEVRYDPATGEDRRNFPPDRLVDFLSMDLAVEIADMNTPRMSGVETLKFSPVGSALSVLKLNAEQMKIRGVSVGGKDDSGGKPVAFTYDDHVLTIRFDPPLPAGAEATVGIEYELDDPPQGVTWTPESKDWPDRPAQMHTQGQPETNRFWFPCHDFPNERLTTKLKITVPQGFQAVSNGKLEGEPVTKDGRTTFQWNQETDHVNYLVMMAVGKWDVVDVGKLNGAQFRIPMPVYAPLGMGDRVERTYARTPEMIKTFEERFGVPYAWAKYAQVVVWNFGAGGMENTSATTLYDTAVLDEMALKDGDLDGLISHELAHQWFGDLITCNSWAHIWLNEGWATYSTGLWLEKRDGFDGKNGGYINYVYGSIRGLAANDQIGEGASREESARPGMVSPVYRHPWEVFRRTSNPYPKGCSILHMLRMKLGDEVFFKAVRTYVSRYQHKTAETDQFRAVFEEVSGQTLEGFFAQWAYRPGTPKVKISADWMEKEKQLKLVVEQTQKIDAALPAFRFTLPVVMLVGQERHEATIDVDGRRHEQRIDLPSDPDMVAVDPQLTVLMDLSVDQPTRRFIRQLQSGPTSASRLDAAKALARNTGNKDAVAALKGSVRDPAEHFAVRAQAAQSLGQLGRADELLDAVKLGEADSHGGRFEDARVRLGIVRGLAAASSDEAIDALAKIVGNEQDSYAVRSAAIEALGKRGLPGHLPLLVQMLKVESQNDQIRVAALRAIGDMNLKEGLEAVIPYCKAGVMSRTRPVAIETVGRLGHHDMTKAYDAVKAYVNDREDRARGAAATALVEIKDKRGLEALDKAAALTRDDTYRERLQDARGQLAAAVNADKSVEGANAEIDRVKRELELLKQKIKQDEEKK